MLMIAVFSSLCGGQTCVHMADYAKNNEAFLRQFMRLEHGTPSHDAFSRLFRMIEPEPLAKALSRFALDFDLDLRGDAQPVLIATVAAVATRGGFVCGRQRPSEPLTDRCRRLPIELGFRDIRQPLRSAASRLRPRCAIFEILPRLGFPLVERWRGATPSLTEKSGGQAPADYIIEDAFAAINVIS